MENLLRGLPAGHDEPVFGTDFTAASCNREIPLCFDLQPINRLKLIGRLIAER